MDIPAGSLDKTLLSISQQSGKPIAFEQRLVSGLNAPAIKGDLSAGEALQIALQGTDLQDSESASGIVLSAAPREATIAPVTAGVESPSLIPQLQRIEVTGSAIRRVDAETAVPVTILRTEELKKQGVTTTEQLISRISANQSSVGSGRSIGSSSGGAAYADLRGIGPNKTLVLLNGRRLANNATSAINGSGVDLNTIPFAAIDRVEVLRDGASALYGTDAIGGVINFITKKA